MTAVRQVAIAFTSLSSTVLLLFGHGTLGAGPSLIG